MKTVKILKDTTLNFHRPVKAGEILRVTDRHAFLLVSAGVAEEESFKSDKEEKEEKVEKGPEKREKKVEKVPRKRSKK